MRAALFLDGHEDLVVDDVDVAAPIGSEVLITNGRSESVIHDFLELTRRGDCPCSCRP